MSGLTQFLIVVIFAWFVVKVFVYKLFFKDLLQAAIERDPAATGSLVVIFTYAGVKAVAHYRVAHRLQEWRFSALARILSQWPDG